jgi:hypothetical protein
LVPKDLAPRAWLKNLAQKLGPKDFDQIVAIPTGERTSVSVGVVFRNSPTNNIPVVGCV